MIQEHAPARGWLAAKGSAEVPDDESGKAPLCADAAHAPHVPQDEGA
ncbi:MAG: hypothetical protein IPI13_14230 [Actinomycetales bacterium]|uniref:Uncharacterized protein n=1 Tax=Candidatus Phosphoribacter hodrii TaxID=2953743 RepID=A0A935ISK9_9MICO|nr:hypothetical protein [Candidatus Phosphoribacter hodrii]